MGKIQVYYWPMLARGASLVRMLEHTGTPYDYISESSRFGEVLSSRCCLTHTHHILLCCTRHVVLPSSHPPRCIAL